MSTDHGFGSFLALLTLLACTQANISQLTPLLMDKHLAEFMIETRDIVKKNPIQAVACFHYYTPLLQGFANQYALEYEDCLKQTNKSRQAIEDDGTCRLNKLENISLRACSALTLCTSKNTSISVLECFVTTGTFAAKASYQTNEIATDKLNDIADQYSRIEFEEYRCTNATGDRYVRKTYNTFSQLHDCLLGKTELPDDTM